MRVLHVVDNLRLGGTELHVLKLTRALRSRGHAVSLLLIGESGPLSLEYERDGLEIPRVPIGSFLSPSILARVRAISEHIARVDPDVVHAHDRYSNVAIALARIQHRGRRRRWISSQRWGRPASLGWRLASKFAFTNSDCVTANGAGTQRIAQQIAGGKVRVDVTPNFLEGECFVSPDVRRSRQKARLQELGLSFAVGTVLLGAVGRLERVKRVDWMIRAVKLMREQQLPVELLIVGEGSERASLEALARSLDISHRVHFVGERPRLPLSQVMFDVTLLTSSSEGVPNALVESFACGVSCVATDVGGVSALVGDSCGLVVDATDEERFASAVARVASSPDLRTTFERNAYERAVSQWHEDVVLPLVENIYTART